MSDEEGLAKGQNQMEVNEKKMKNWNIDGTSQNMVRGPVGPMENIGSGLADYTFLLSFQLVPLALIMEC